jgi:hypothetical protein
MVLRRWQVSAVQHTRRIKKDNKVDKNIFEIV